MNITQRSQQEAALRALDSYSLDSPSRLPSLLEAEELVLLLRAELLDRSQQIAHLHDQLTAPFCPSSAAWVEGEIDKLQLLIQLADKQIQINRRLLQEQAPQV